MHHYSRVQWQKYILGELKEDEIIIMEEHLYSCDDCMATYLSLLEEPTIPQVPELSQDFTDQVMNQLQFKNSSMKTQFNRKRRELFKYYVVAASITMILMYSGFFNVIANEIPRTTTEIVSSTQKVEELVPVGWSQRWMDSTFATLHSITIKQGSEKNEN